MVSWLTLINRLLPFATPGTPLVQDVLHLAAICGVLYFAPQIQEYLHQRHTEAAGDGVNREAVVENSDGAVINGDVQDAHGHDAQGIANDIAPQARHEAPQEREEDEEEEDHAQAGPANAPDAPAVNTTQRNVGAKKAKSLAKRDQRRAYHEFMRSQGEAQRERDADGAAEREAALDVERQRRRATEASLEAKKAKERESKRETEKREREEEIRRREMAVRIVREELGESRMCDLFKVARRVGGDDVDEEWVERMVKAAGILGRREGSLTMITGMGWAVRVSEGELAEAYRVAVEQKGADDGRVSFDELGSILETTLRAHAVT